MAPTSMEQSVTPGKVSVKHPTLAHLCLLLIADLEETGWMVKLELKKKKKIAKSISHFSFACKGKEALQTLIKIQF